MANQSNLSSKLSSNFIGFLCCSIHFIYVNNNLPAAHAMLLRLLYSIIGTVLALIDRLFGGYDVT